MNEKLNVAVLPAGAWGTAFAKISADREHNVKLYFRSSSASEFFNNNHRSPRLPTGIELPGNVAATNSLEEAVLEADILVLSPPSLYLRDLYKKIRPFMEKDTPILCLTKGLERETDLRMSQVLREEEPEINSRLAILSGPNFASEIAKGLPAATVIASEDADLAELMQKAFSTSRFRIYTQKDVIGVEFGGAFKNVIAIAAGVSDGLDMGENARAALVNRGLAEIKRLGLKLGGEEATFNGLSGAGDLWLTCTSFQSRNHQLGVELAAGKTVKELLTSGTVYEGFYTAKAMVELAKRYGISVPIAEAVYEVLYQGVTIDKAITRLVARTLTSENGNV